MALKTYAFEYGAALFTVIRADSISNLQTIARWVEEQAGTVPTSPADRCFS